MKKTFNHTLGNASYLLLDCAYRVKVFATLNGGKVETKGLVTGRRPEDGMLFVTLDNKTKIIAHPKQCRRLKKKTSPTKAVTVTRNQIIEAWDNEKAFTKVGSPCFDLFLRRLGL